MCVIEWCLTAAVVGSNVFRECEKSDFVTIDRILEIHDGICNIPSSCYRMIQVRKRTYHPRNLRLKVNAATKAAIKRLLQLSHFLLDALELRLERLDLAVDRGSRRFQKL